MTLLYRILRRLALVALVALVAMAALLVAMLFTSMTSEDWAAVTWRTVLGMLATLVGPSLLLLALAWVVKPADLRQ